MISCLADEIGEGFPSVSCDCYRKHLKTVVVKNAVASGAFPTQSLKQSQACSFAWRGGLSVGNEFFEPGQHESWFLSLHFGGEAAAVELEVDRVAELDLGGVAEDGAPGIGGDGVA